MKLKTRRILAKHNWVFYLLPSFALLCMFYIVPIFMAAYFSFTKYNVFQPPAWVGLQNYARIFKDVFFKSSLRNTLVYAAIVVPATILFSLVTAAVLASFCRNRFGNFIRSSLFIPVISSTVLVGTVWKFMFASNNGLINNIIGLFGVPAVNWLGQRSTALLTVCIAAVWKNVGYFMVIYYAGIMDIPRSYYEAAEVDGATSLQQFFHITIPLLKPVTFLSVSLCTIWSFQVFDLAYTMGGPSTSTTTLVMTIYNAAFKEHLMGYACALSMVLFAIVMVISFVQRKFLDEKD